MTVGAGAAVVAVIAIAALVLLRLDDEPFVDRIRLENRTAYDLEVEVSSAERNGWVGISTAQARTTSEVTDVIDQGSTWVFHFSYGGVDAGEVVLSKADLERTDWTVHIPQSAAERLSAAGVRPPP